MRQDREIAAGARIPTEAELTHDRLGERFREGTSEYDTAQRVHTLIDEFLVETIAPGRERPLAGLRVLDVGCGLGFFSQRLHELGARVTACDIGPSLVEGIRARVGCEAVVADALALHRTFGKEQFDVVVSSECIEHTPAPYEALAQMAAVLKRGGWLSVSTPNVLWKPLVAAATILKVRPFDGYENFSTFAGIESALTRAGVTVEQRKGLHLWPFQLPLHSASRWVDAHAQVLKRLMINLCVLGRRRS
jgi:2-polyprenyl-3-methyl-5-hydroxy-6-metoxy-1,4-benzoquinol methylase